jgi:hypothetical protein
VPFRQEVLEGGNERHDLLDLEVRCLLLHTTAPPKQAIAAAVVAGSNYLFAVVSFITNDRCILI